jgi:heterotetrameric sarcosine oxidase gamma subunit
VIDAPVTLSTAPAGDVIVLDLWDEVALPDAANLLQVEPRRWWLIDAGDGAAAIAAQIGGAGALTPIGGGLVRATLAGPGWRALLTVSACFDSENPSFAPGQVAATILHHVPVWIAVTGDNEAQVYMASSYAPTLIALWTQAIGVA